MRKKYFWGLFILWGACILPMQADAQVTNTVVANFNDGNTATAVDGYEGMVGDGWAEPWVLAERNDGCTTSVGVEPGTGGLYPEIHSGDGNYLNMQLWSTDGNVRASIARDYQGGIDPTKSHTIGFTVRINELNVGDESLSKMDSDRDYYSLTLSDTNRTDNSSRDVFRITAAGTEDYVGPEAVRKWAVVDGSSDAYFSSDIPLVQGGVYDFTMFVDTKNLTYDVTISDGTNSYTANDLGWVTDKTYSGSWLNIITACSEQNETRDLSIDNFHIEQTLQPVGTMTEVINDFSDGNTATPNGFTGAPGDGWKTRWIVSERSDPELVATVLTSGDTGYEEIRAGDGNYLKLQVGSESGESRVALTRGYADEPGIDYTKNHTVEFTIRIDENIDTENGSTMTNRKDRYAISCSDTSRTTPDGSDRFCILAAGDDDDWGSAVVRQWAFSNGDRAGNIVEFIGSGIELVEGGIYDFTVEINVDEESCDITVDDGTASFTADDLAWGTSTGQVGGFLNFMATCNSSTDTRGMSIDNIRISQVPEPSTIVMLAGLLAGVLIWRRKK